MPPNVKAVDEFGDEDVAFDTEEEDAVPKDGGGGSGRGKGAKKPKDEACPIPDCPELRRKGARFCGRHDRHYNNMRYQAEQQGQEQLEEFSKTMKPLAVAVVEVEKFSAKNAAIPEGKHKALVDWAEFNTQHGIKLSNSAHSVTAPYEKRQWIIRQVSKFGREEKVAIAAWEHFSLQAGRGIKSDNLGFGGQQRLWLPKGEFEDNSVTKFIQGALVQGGGAEEEPQRGLDQLDEDDAA
jgi:hypothetical protein